MANKAPNATDEYVGKRIRMRRLTVGQSQTWLGDQLGVTFQQVQKYEKGINRVGASRMQQMADVLEVPVSYFFDGGPNDGKHRATPADAIDFLSTRYGVRISQSFPKIRSEELQRQIVGLIEAVATK